jgi:hypothetical protein
MGLMCKYKIRLRSEKMCIILEAKSVHKIHRCYHYTVAPWWYTNCITKCSQYSSENIIISSCNQVKADRRRKYELQTMYVFQRSYSSSLYFLRQQIYPSNVTLFRWLSLVNYVNQCSIVGSIKVEVWWRGFLGMQSMVNNHSRHLREATGPMVSWKLYRFSCQS